jgi:hypothetical protein
MLLSCQPEYSLVSCEGRTPISYAIIFFYFPFGPHTKFQGHRTTHSVRKVSTGEREFGMVEFLCSPTSQCSCSWNKIEDPHWCTPHPPLNTKGWLKKNLLDQILFFSHKSSSGDQIFQILVSTPRN